jgi:hypothetical protein
MTTDIVGSAIEAGTRIGRSFGIVSLFPALFFVLGVWALFGSGGVSGRPSANALMATTGDITLGGGIAVLIIALALGFVLHPIQFSFIQMLEGYWGTSHSGLALMALRIRHYRHQRRALLKIYGDSELQIDEPTSAARKRWRGDYLAVPLLVAHQQAGMALQEFPDDVDRIMPTRLGNVLRRYEDRAGRTYALDGIVAAPAISTVAAPERLGYLNGAREQLDAAVSVCVLSALLTATYIGTLLTDGFWLLIALLPYTSCYLAYRGAVRAAHEYGVALVRLVDLDRFAPAEPGRVSQQRREPPRPPVHGDMVDVDATLGQQLLHIPVGQAEPQIPAHRQHDHLGREPENAERAGTGTRVDRIGRTRTDLADAVPHSSMQQCRSR